MPSRRSFLRRASGVVAAIAAPMFIPSERLEFGVPRTIALPELLVVTLQEPWTPGLAFGNEPTPVFWTPSEAGDGEWSDAISLTSKTWNNVFLNVQEIGVLVPIPERLSTVPARPLKVFRSGLYQLPGIG